MSEAIAAIQCLLEFITVSPGEKLGKRAVFSQQETERQSHHACVSTVFKNYFAEPHGFPISAETLVHLREDIKQATELLTKSDRGMVTAISSGCELFLRFITLATFDYSVSDLVWVHDVWQTGLCVSATSFQEKQQCVQCNL